MTPLQALQQALAGEHAAVYLYGVLGARVSQSKQASLSAELVGGYTTHRGRRDALTSLVRAAGGTPVAAALSYRLPGAASTPDQLRAAAVLVERRCSALYAQLVGSTSRADRRFALGALTDSAVRELSFGGRPSAYPGAPELG